MTTAGRRRLALLALALVEIGWLASAGHLAGAIRWSPVVGALGLHLAVVGAERRRAVLRPGEVRLAVAAVAVAAVACTPFGSRDLFQYATYGRMVAVHHVDPYVHGPAAVAGDPIAAETASGWAEAPSVYGPVFTWFSALAARAYGDSPLLARLAFQGLAAASLLVACDRLRRRGAPGWQLLALGLAPPVVAAVNGGHNDLVAGGLAFVGWDLLERRRAVGGAVLLATACLVKASVAPVVVAVVLAAAARRRWGEACSVAVAVAGVVALAYVAAGGWSAVAPLRGLGDHRSRASPWALVERVGLGAPPGGLATAATAASVLVVLAGAWRARWPAGATAVSLGVVVCCSGASVLPWYPMAFLPLAVGQDRSRARTALAAASAALLLAYVQPPGRPVAELAGASLVGAAASVVLLLTLIATIGEAVAAVRSSPVSRPARASSRRAASAEG
ncbi:DUF2029 domain-containing protein [Aquihabitans sp. G128]|uniref:glycosyltransferase 87 family protein n=1 Tax=Aquihabitans sp. G128 TaxID=2849779 RepID=UPI001C23F765|nr:glycosyltransferase 87 family protein [Aquihabitans sp. G128]QXC60991.1 DUF2029 domain-containing protein [Aquihabitans sp. G128]